MCNWRRSTLLEKLATIQMLEVWIPLLDGRWLALPEKDAQALDQTPLHSALPTTTANRGVAGPSAHPETGWDSLH
jgi:hypothetical protein